MTDKELVAAIGALVGPAVIALVQRPTWSPRRRMLVAFLVLLAWTLLVFFFLGGATPPWEDWRAWLRLLLINIVVVASSYQWIFKQLGLSQWIEARTSFPQNATERAGVAALDNEVDKKASPPHLPPH